MRKYQVMFIINPDLDIEKVKSVTNNICTIFTSNGGNVKNIKEIGKKDLAYEIDHHKKGYYVELIVEAPIEAVNEFNRLIIITEPVIRFIIVNEE
jgi:small subunit ribosomal protein S6